VDFKKRLLILDLDETLIHSVDQYVPKKSTVKVDHWYVYPRPGLIPFLRDISALYYLAVWSAADELYVNSIISKVIPNDIIFEFIWDRSRCTKRIDIDTKVSYYEKNLKKVKKLNYSLDDIIIVDDIPENASRNYGNLITVKPYYGETYDDELPKLFHYLKYLSTKENIRSIEKRGWKGQISLT